MLVLGAGASVPYGFPTSHELLLSIVEDLRSDQPSSMASVVTRGAKSVYQDVKAFRDELQASTCTSVDEFIERRSGDYGAIGRCSIGYQLLQREDDAKLSPGLEVDWYRALFGCLCGDGVEAYERNQLRIITFNFDRSFERALFLALRREFEDADVERLLDVVPVIHAHGDLGPPRWRRGFATDMLARAYTRGGVALELHWSWPSIRIADQPLQKETGEEIRAALSWASRILFLGFGYNDSNLRKLGVPESLNRKLVYGTRLNLGAERVAEVERLTGNGISFFPSTWTIMTALRELTWFCE